MHNRYLITCPWICNQTLKHVLNFEIFKSRNLVKKLCFQIQYIPRNMHTVFALLCFVVVIHWLIFPYPSGLLHWHCGNLTIAPVPAKQPWWIWINTSCEFIMNDCITTTKQSTTKPCAYFLGYTVGMDAYDGRIIMASWHEALLSFSVGNPPWSSLKKSHVNVNHLCCHCMCKLLLQLLWLGCGYTL